MKKNISTIQKILLMTLVIIIGAGFYISIVYHSRLDASAAFYIGLPALISVLVIMTNPSDSPMGATMKGITLALLLSVPLLQEGFLCVLFAAPLFYAVGAIVAYIYTRCTRKNTGDKNIRAYAPLLLLAVVATEGTTDALSFNRDTVVTVERVIASPAATVAANLEKPARFTKDVPLFLRIFPQPSDVAQQGDEQRMHFVYKKHIWFNARAGDVVFKISERGENYIHSEVTSDSSYLHTYMDWKSSRVAWQAIDDTHTRVSWTIRYKRKLDPAWYFAPMEEYAVQKVGEMLINTAANPGDA
jgi:hypothetical protein